MSLRFSIIINTYNRADNLAVALEALCYLRHSNFEVIVVNGPSTDHTEQVLSKFEGRIKIGTCPETNLSQSRNIGIRLADSDIVCFIDDDGIAEPDWLDALERVYLASPEAGAVGGFVRDHTGVDYQCRYIVCDRAADAHFRDNYNDIVFEQKPRSRLYYTVIGVNSSFRLKALLDIGGFDEEYAYFLDETDVCARLVDAGWKIHITPDAEVHHKYAKSHLRHENKVPKSLYFNTRSKVYFGFRNAIPDTPPHALYEAAVHIRNRLRWDADNLRRIRSVSEEQHLQLLEDVERGFHDGIQDWHAHPLGRGIPTTVWEKQPFQAFPLKRPVFQRKNLILISQEYPPKRCGGIGVFIHRLAEALAADGHEVSVITRSSGRHTVDFENGVWVHRVPIIDHGSRNMPALPDLPGTMRHHAYTVYDEAIRIQTRRGPAVTLSAIWDLEAIACVASKAFFNIVYLVTTYQLSVASKPEWQKDAHYLEHHVLKMIEGERWILENCDQVIASTRGIGADVSAMNENLTFKRSVPIIPFGLPVAPPELPSVPAGYDTDKINVLFVGRFENRKGTDLLLEAIPELMKRHPNLAFRLAGDDTLIVDGVNYKNRFLEQHAGNKQIIENVQFLGFLDDLDLDAEYAHCSIFVAPSRYESFGLIYLEAMRWGKPCIGTETGGIPDVVTPECGILVAPDRADGLVEAIDTLATDPEKRAKMGDAGRQRFIEVFSVKAFTTALITHMDDVVEIPF